MEFDQLIRLAVIVVVIVPIKTITTVDLEDPRELAIAASLTIMEWVFSSRRIPFPKVVP
jgi:hypothetical protein